MFKEAFKYYKSRNPMPSFDEVIDFHSSSSEDVLAKATQLCANSNLLANRFDLIEFVDWQIYGLDGCPGFIYIKNPFTSIGQRFWIRQALEEFTKKPNRLNIDIHSLVPADQNWWNYARNNNNVLRKLRWSTLGYHHNWNTKVYSEDAKDEFPENLSSLCDIFAQVLDLKFKAEAAIVNFYHLDSTLSGHTDHSEDNLDAPLLSFSFGNSAIFLLGGTTINQKPTAVFLHSGDVVVMSKDSRLSYHGVPRIVKNERMVWNDFNSICSNEETNLYTNSAEFQPFQEYLIFSRVNLNVRQVLADGQTQLKQKNSSI